MSRKVKEPIEPENPEKSGKSDTEKIAKLTDDLKKYDDVGYSRAQEAELSAIVDELASIGSPAVPELIGMLSDPANWSSSFAAGALGKIGDARAIIPLADVLEDSDLGGSANDALKEFGEIPREGSIKFMNRLLDILLPAGAIMNALSGGELGWEDTFEEEYGEYFEEVGGLKSGREDPDDDDWADDSDDSGMYPKENSILFTSLR